MKRLDTIFTSKDLLGYRHWVLDVQGAELKVLQGAGDLLSNVESLFIESRNTSVYQGVCKWNELVYFLQDKGFKNLWSPINDEEDKILFIRRNYASKHSHNSSIQVKS
jgi:hypothetical protein